MVKCKMRASLSHCALLHFILGTIDAARGAHHGASERAWTIDAVMPDHPAQAESYLCMRVDLPNEGALKLIGVEPLSKQEVVHHMLLFGCEQRTDAQGVWPCEGHGVCPGGGSQQILYGWAKGAPPMHLPHGVGYRVGSGTKIDNLVLQIHFGVARPEKDTSGIKIHLSNAHVPFSAGMLMYASSFEIPAKRPEHLVPTRCCYSGFEPTHGFAFRVHTHSLGRSVYLDEILEGESHRRIVEHSPQLPQGFTPASGVTFWPGQSLEATCNFNSMERTSSTWAGSTHHDEMCNLYMIMWSELPVFMACYGGHASIDRNGAGGVAKPAALLPEDPSHWNPPQPIQDRAQNPSGFSIGQVAGVVKGHNGTIWVFHRGDRVWAGDSFSGPKMEHTTFTDPIEGDTVLQLDQDTGEVLVSWGKATFFMPHMITVDRWGFLWLTDVGLHQVFKYDAEGNLLLTLGSRLSPGTGASFCKPTHVAVANDGSIYVSDGYCNSRVAHFDANGNHLGDFALEQGAMSVPHSVVLEECYSFLMVADREAAKVHRFDLGTRKHSGSWDLSNEGLVFGLVVGPYGTLFALCWDRNRQKDGLSRLVLLHSDPGQGVEESWLLQDVESPHDLAIIAAPVRLAAAERPIAVLVGETRASGSRLHKFVLVPAGMTHLPNGTADVGSATKQWQAVFAATAATEQEIPPEIASTKTADVHHTQAAIAEAETAHIHRDASLLESPREDGGAVISAAQGGVSRPGWSLASRQQGLGAGFLLVFVPMLFCCGGVALVCRQLYTRQSSSTRPHM